MFLVMTCLVIDILPRAIMCLPPIGILFLYTCFMPSYRHVTPCSGFRLPYIGTCLMYTYTLNMLV